MSTVKPAGMRILMLHGFTQSGKLFHAKTRAIEKALSKSFPECTLHYATGPVSLKPSEVPGFEPSNHTNPDGEVEVYAWWRRKEGTPMYAGIDEGLQRLADTIRSEGPFDGVIGFSQGGCASGIVASLLDPGRKEAMDAAHAQNKEKIPYPASFMNDSGVVIQPQLKFAIVYSGFAAPSDYYGSLYDPKIKTPTLHWIGSLDTLVDEDRSRLLASCCEGYDKNVIVHPGGHFVPTQKTWLDMTIGFISKCMDGKPSENEGEVKAEDMDMPF